MKTTLEYIEEAKERLGITSDYALAKWLDVPRETVSGYRTKRRTIDDYAAARIAEALGVAPLQIIAAANAEREKDDRKRSFWEQLAKGSTTAILAVGVIGTAVHDVRAVERLNPEYLLSASNRRSKRWAGAA